MRLVQVNMPQRRNQSWTFLTNHAVVLLEIAEHPTITIRSVAATLGLAERSVAAMIRDLREAGYLEMHKSGRNNVYRIRDELPFRRPAQGDHRVGELLDVLLGPSWVESQELVDSAPEEGQHVSVV